MAKQHRVIAATLFLMLFVVCTCFLFLFNIHAVPMTDSVSNGKIWSGYPNSPHATTPAKRDLQVRVTKCLFFGGRSIRMVNAR